MFDICYSNYAVAAHLVGCLHVNDEILRSTVAVGRQRHIATLKHNTCHWRHCYKSARHHLFSDSK